MNNDTEVRYVIYAQLQCPEPLKYYQNTRSYESLKYEYELLNQDKLTDLELTLILNKCKNTLNLIPVYILLNTVLLTGIAVILYNYFYGSTN